MTSMIRADGSGGRAVVFNNRKRLEKNVYIPREPVLAFVYPGNGVSL